MIRFEDNPVSNSRIIVIGVGGGASIVVDKIAQLKLDNLETAIIDTDLDVLNSTRSGRELHISRDKIKHLAVSGSSNISKQKLSRELDNFCSSLPPAEIVFVISGLGGMTATVVAPYLVQALKNTNQWVWSLFTVPFFFEGKQKTVNSLKAIKQVQTITDAVMVIPHDKVFRMVDRKVSMGEAFTVADCICAGVIDTIQRLTHANSWVSIDFPAVKEIISNRKGTAFGTGKAKGSDMIYQAIDQALSSPLLGKEVIRNSHKLLISIFGGDDLTIKEIDAGIDFLSKQIPKQVNINFGAATLKDLKGQVRVSIVALGLDSKSHADISGNLDLAMAARTTSVTAANQQKPVNKLKSSAKPRQTMLNFKAALKGRFERSAPTIHHGEDLDIPTFLRRKSSFLKQD